MRKKIIISGLLGGIVLIVWNFLFNGIFGFNARINMNQIPQEQIVYDVLKQNILEPGRYICNPALTNEKRYPDNEPVYSIHYSGMGHGTAGRGNIIGLIIFILVPTIATWMLSSASEKILTNYWKKVCFFISIGLLIALFSDMRNYGIEGYPLKESILLAFSSIVQWTLIGLVIAWKLKPKIN